MTPFKTTAFIASLGLLAALSSCASFKSRPVDLAQEEASWKNAVSGNRALPLSQARQLGLVLNPDLNKARLKLAASEDAEKQAGWWNDPSFSWDVKQVLQQDEKTLNLDGGLSFTIPVTGLPGLEKQVAAQYREADYWALRQAELDFLSSLEQKWAEWGTTRQKRDLSGERFAELKKEDAAFESLYKIGEIDFASRQIATQRLNNAQTEFQNAAEDELDKRMELVKFLGLHPSAAEAYKLTPPSNDRIPSTVATPSAKELTAAPKVLGQLASYAGSETLLKTEIRKQYPEIQLGPAFTRDDGEKELGGSLGFDIPLWNRNRKAIAEAEGNRNTARFETVQLWKDLLSQTEQLSKEQKMVQAHCQSDLKRLDNYKSNLKRLEKLHSLGESSLADLSEGRQQVYESRMAFLDSLNKLLFIQAQLRYLASANPSKN